MIPPPADNAVTWGQFQVVLLGRAHSSYEQAFDAEQLAAKFRSMGWRSHVVDRAAKPPARLSAATKSTEVIKGFRVRAGSVILSKLYTVRGAADEVMELARKTGHPDATVEVVRGRDDADGLL